MYSNKSAPFEQDNNTRPSGGVKIIMTTAVDKLSSVRDAYFEVVRWLPDQAPAQRQAHGRAEIAQADRLVGVCGFGPLFGGPDGYAHERGPVQLNPPVLHTRRLVGGAVPLNPAAACPPVHGPCMPAALDSPRFTGWKALLRKIFSASRIAGETP